MIDQAYVDKLMKHVVYDHGCWTYIGSRSQHGYGKYGNGTNGHSQFVHRVVYESEMGPIQPGLELDHLCRNRACCNPAHLEQVTHEENKRRARRTHCKNGHAYAVDKTRSATAKNGPQTYRAQVCDVCRRDAVRRFKQRKRGA